MVCEGDRFGRSTCLLSALKSASSDLHVSRRSRASRRQGREIEPLRQMFIALKNADRNIQISRNSQVEDLQRWLI